MQSRIAIVICAIFACIAPGVFEKSSDLRCGSLSSPETVGNEGLTYGALMAGYREVRINLSSSLLSAASLHHDRL